MAVIAQVSVRVKASWAHWVYRFLAVLLSCPALLWLWWRGGREPGYRQALIERLGFAHALPAAHGGLWIHTASVGEAQATLTLWPNLKAAWGAHAITWTTQTPAARVLIIERTGGEVHPFFAPLDTVGSVRRFLSRVQPRMLLLLEREIWPEWLWQCEQQAITVVLANARLKQSNVQQWPNNTQWMRRRLRSITKILSADESSYKSFLSMGMAQDLLSLTGNLKFDQTLMPKQSSTLRDALHGRAVIVAASTHEADEEATLTHWPTWATANPNALLVVAPRHPQRFADVAQRLQNLLGTEAPSKLAIWSLRDSITPNTQVLLLDTIGELTQVYPLAKVCLMGGTWSKVGGHNALEPLSAECPVLFGPHTQQFPDLYGDMQRSGCAIRVESSEIWLKVTELLNNLDMLKLMQGAGLAFVKAHQGSAKRTMHHLQQLKCWPVKPMTPVKISGCKDDCVWFHSASIFHLENKELEGSNYVGNSEALATGSGRGQALKVKIDGTLGVLRHYKRGGLIAKLRADTYPSASTNMSRAMQEFSLLREMRSVGLSVPEPLAARYLRVRPWLGRFSTYRADILVEWLTNTQNLAQKLDHGRLSTSTWLSIGETIAQLHAYGIDHTDLNCHNILIGDDGHVWLVDFDKCSRRSDGEWREANLRRLLRSLRKEDLRRPGFCWVEQDWDSLIEGYKKHAF